MIILLRGYIQKAPFGALKDSYIPTHLTVLEGKQRNIRSVEGQVSPLTFNILGSVLLSLSCCLPQSDYSIDSYHFLPYIDYSMVSVHLAICRETFAVIFLANYIWGTVTITIVGRGGLTESQPRSPRQSTRCWLPKAILETDNIFTTSAWTIT